jgi:tetratricopeptide (TPR) repeat protein
MSDQKPSFHQIAELFQLQFPAIEGTGKVSSGRKAKGENASESEELGRLSLSEGDYQAAIEHFRRAVEQREELNPDTLVDLAGAYDYGEFEPQALRQYQKAWRLQKDAAEPLLGISDLYKRNARWRESIERLENAIEIEPGNAFYRIKLAETLREMGEKNRALVAAMGAVTAKPDEAFYHYWVGDLQIELGRYEDALESLRAAIELSPGDDFLYLRAAVAFWRTGKQQEAIKAIRLASDLDLSKHVYYGLLEVLLRQAGMPEEAELERQRSSKMDLYDRDTLKRVMREMGIV